MSKRAKSYNALCYRGVPGCIDMAKQGNKNKILSLGDSPLSKAGALTICLESDRSDLRWLTTAMSLTVVEIILGPAALRVAGPKAGFTVARRLLGYASDCD